jgi:hypothetical protein
MFAFAVPMYYDRPFVGLPQKTEYKPVRYGEGFDPGQFIPCQTGPILPLGTDIDALLRVLEEEQRAGQK